MIDDDELDGIFSAMNAHALRVDERLDRIEARQRAHRQHDPECLFYIGEMERRRSADPGIGVWHRCDCWLKED